MRWDYLGIFTGLFKNKSADRALQPVNVCSNCNHSQDTAFKYCPECGQSGRPSKITFLSLIRELLSNVFNLDASLYRSFLWLPVPAYLSKKYVKGERKQFLNPIRFFFFSMLLFFALIVTFLNKSEIDEETSEGLIKVEKSLMLDTFNMILEDTILANLSTSQISFIKESLFDGIKPSDQDSILNIGFDSSSIVFLNGRTSLLRKDLFHKSVDDILADSDIDNWSTRLAVGQIIRVTRDLSGAVNFLVGNGIWVFVTGIFLLSFILKIIYFRKKRFFIEHSIILFHTHAFAFVVGILCILWYKYIHATTSVIWYGLIISGLYVIISLKSYYQQGWIKTFIKFLIISVFYAFIMSILALVVVLLSLLFFN